MPYQALDSLLLYRPLRSRLTPPPSQSPTLIKRLGISQSDIDIHISILQRHLQSNEKRYKVHHENIRAAIRDLRNGIAGEYYQRGERRRMCDLILNHKFLRRYPVWMETWFYLPTACYQRRVLRGNYATLAAIVREGYDDDDKSAGKNSEEEGNKKEKGNKNVKGDNKEKGNNKDTSSPHAIVPLQRIDRRVYEEIALEKPVLQHYLPYPSSSPIP
ncbi:hypothetical protein TWF569_004550 [Orbilia oligospora]|uniref:Uncharacterized protein n=1 Tax=Orbilia oligospora TaxID=2813651 RepID=A0A7C8NG70_ORBOL|nr:hypothetical protein TWF102_006088 [Orbilia oligospora]KAF3098554.1 hypothetical protein TWF103_008991 [Orbilia oligospora]KAF3126988.1 hypothetical protein TWF703_010279 [Orbilia oligospora]KAF3144296.1 hypothetical protein TWF594_004827 [Orbilia oligospora]KAF3150674.1 hypothetical protein TWF569_004550 [Orbilia oligospora]